MFVLRRSCSFMPFIFRDLFGRISFTSKSVYSIASSSPSSHFVRLCSSGQISQVKTQKSEDSVDVRVDQPLPASWNDIGVASDINTEAILSKDLLVYNNFITEEEEKSLFDEVEPYLKRLRYEETHWDDAILGYRETEKKTWSQKNKGILERVRKLAFPPGTAHLAYVHVLDLKATGVIKAHVDSVKFCGTTISGICLLSSAVMKLVNEKDKSFYADILLPRRCLYVMRNRARYEYTHEVLGGETSKFKGVEVLKDRRIAIICRNEPDSVDSGT